MFTLNERLAADTVPITSWPLCRVLLMKDRLYPWLILVPEIPDIKEIIDLAPLDQHRLMDEIAQASTALQTLFTPDKINVAALGNVVPQLHIHVIARFTNDAAWPGPVWGVKPAVPYDDAEQQSLVTRLQAVLS